MKNQYKVLVVVAALTAFVGLGVGQTKLQSQAANSKVAPSFEVDPFWPKPLPNHWLLGSVIGVTVDSRDHVYIVHRTDAFQEFSELGLKAGTSECCTPAPPIIEFDAQGNVVNAWGGQGEGYTWPQSNHGIEIDKNGNVWIGGNGIKDSHVLKFSKDGKFLQEFGIPGKEADSNSKEHFAGVAEIAIDKEANEAYIADGYRNKRVAVLDVDTGEFKRYWGAYGNKPADTKERYRHDPSKPPSKQFTGPVHCAEPSNDGLLYVCDRTSNRIQVFRKDGSFIKEAFFAPQTLAQGSTWDIVFSTDSEQKYIFMPDGQNQKIYIIERESLEVLTAFGDGGRQPGLFYAPHSIAIDSKGNLYTTETYEGKRVQKFVNKGIRTIPGRNQGAPWPISALGGG